MKKIIALITLIVCCFSLFACQDLKGDIGSQGPQGDKGDKGDPGESSIITYDGTEGLDFYPLSDGTYGVKAGKASYLEEVVIPAEYNGKKVTQILDRAFNGCSNLKSITIPPSVTTIGTGAFTFTSLTNVEIPSSVNTIGEGAFSACASLASIEISEGVKKICDSAFFCCTSLKSIEIPASVTIIHSRAFQECVSLESISFAENSQLTTIESNAFYFCSALKNLEIPANTTIIGLEAFVSCQSLESIKILSNVDTIGASAFAGCTSLTSIEFSGGITSINEYAFYGCSSIKSIVLPEGLTTIAFRAFSNCTSLENLTIPASVTYFDEESIYNCVNLTNITYKGTVEQWNAFSFDWEWNHGVPAIEVICSDGIVPLIEIPEGYIKPTGTLIITGGADGNIHEYNTNTEIDISNYKYLIFLDIFYDDWDDWDDVQSSNEVASLISTSAEIPEGYIKPTGTLIITGGSDGNLAEYCVEDTPIDISTYQYLIINIPVVEDDWEA